MATNDMEKAEIFKIFLIMVFIVKTGFQWSLVPKTCKKVWTWSFAISIKWTNTDLWDLVACTHKHWRSWQQPADITVRTLVIIHEKQWQHGDLMSCFQRTRKKPYVPPVFQRVKKEDPGNYRWVSHILENYYHHHDLALKQREEWYSLVGPKHSLILRNGIQLQDAELLMLMAENNCLYMN